MRSETRSSDARNPLLPAFAGLGGNGDGGLRAVRVEEPVVYSTGTPSEADERPDRVCVLCPPQLMRRVKRAPLLAVFSLLATIWSWSRPRPAYSPVITIDSLLVRPDYFAKPGVVGPPSPDDSARTPIVYNIEVGGLHNYLVGTQRVLVHNK